MAGGQSELYQWHDGQSKGRGLSQPGGLSAGAGQCGDLDNGVGGTVFMDPADVPLQWLVLPLDLGGDWRDQRVPAAGFGKGDI